MKFNLITPLDKTNIDYIRPKSIPISNNSFTLRFSNSVDAEAMYKWLFENWELRYRDILDCPYSLDYYRDERVDLTTVVYGVPKNFHWIIFDEYKQSPSILVLEEVFKNVGLNFSVEEQIKSGPMPPPHYSSDIYGPSKYVLDNFPTETEKSIRNVPYIQTQNDVENAHNKDSHMYEIIRNWYLDKGAHLYVLNDELDKIDDYFMNGIPENQKWPTPDDDKTFWYGVLSLSIRMGRLTIVKYLLEKMEEKYKSPVIRLGHYQIWCNMCGYRELHDVITTYILDRV